MKARIWAGLLVATTLISFSQENDNSRTPTTFPDAIQQMHSAMSSVRLSGDTDTDFDRLMIPHHQAAIDMAKLEILHGTDPQLRRLAQQIVTDQQSEIELMQLWLAKNQHSPRKER